MTRSSGRPTGGSSTLSGSKSSTTTSPSGNLFGRPDDQKLVSSLTLFAGVAADLGDEWASTVGPGQRGPRPRRRAGPAALRRHATLPRRRCSILTPPRSLELDRELARLQRRYHVASHEVGELGVRPDGIDDDTLAWWIAAHRAKWRRRFERSETIAITEPVEQVELRKNRLRKPPR